MDEVLQGTKGEISYYTDNVGKVTDTVSKKDPGAGNDVYLTIDKDLQEQTYKLLEEKLAGIVRSKLRNVMNYDPSTTNDSSEIIIPVDDAYNAFIANEILDETLQRIRRDFNHISGVFSINCVFRYLLFSQEHHMEDYLKTMSTLGEHAGLIGFGEHYNQQFVNQTMTCVVFE